MNKYLDAHCHLFDVLLPDNIGAIVNATKPADWDAVIRLSNEKPNVWGAIGVHPWYLADLPNDWDVRLYDLLVRNPNIMVGEIGLDKHKLDMDKQIAVFVRQLEIAHNLSRGVHIHCVGAWDKVLHIFKSYAKKMPPFVLFHRFDGKAQDIVRLVNKYNAYFSYHKITPELLSNTPIDRILVETDSTNPAQVVAITDSVATLYPECDLYNNAQRMLKNG